LNRLFCFPLKCNTKKFEQPAEVEEIVKFPAGTFEYEASAILKANRDNPLNMLLFVPPGGEEVTKEYISMQSGDMLLIFESFKHQKENEKFLHIHFWNQYFELFITHFFYRSTLFYD
jgi:hypothetical protein